MELLFPIHLLSCYLNLLLVYCSLLGLLFQSISSVLVLFLGLNKSVSLLVFSAEFFLCFCLLDFLAIFIICDFCRVGLAIKIALVLHPSKKVLFFIEDSNSIEIAEKVVMEVFLDFSKISHYNFLEFLV